MDDGHGNCRYVNERWVEMTGMPSVQAMGRGWLAVTHPDDRDRVFERFVRLDAARQRHHGGAGLGLSMCAAIAGLHHGSISLLTDREPGAHFVVELGRYQR